MLPFPTPPPSQFLTSKNAPISYAPESVPGNGSVFAGEELTLEHRKWKRLAGEELTRGRRKWEGLAGEELTRGRRKREHFRW